MEYIHLLPKSNDRLTPWWECYQIATYSILNYWKHAMPKKKNRRQKLPSKWLWSIHEIINDQVLVRQYVLNVHFWTGNSKQMKLNQNHQNKKSFFYHLNSVHCFFYCYINFDTILKSHKLASHAFYKFAFK